MNSRVASRLLGEGRARTSKSPTIRSTPPGATPQPDGLKMSSPATGKRKAEELEDSGKRVKVEALEQGAGGSDGIAPGTSLAKGGALSSSETQIVGEHVETVDSIDYGLDSSKAAEPGVTAEDGSATQQTIKVEQPFQELGMIGIEGSEAEQAPSISLERSVVQVSQPDDDDEDVPELDVELDPGLEEE
jgi:hypothetical protein